MTSEIADCCNGPSNHQLKCFETKPKESYFD